MIDSTAQTFPTEVDTSRYPHPSLCLYLFNLSDKQGQHCMQLLSDAAMLY